MIYDPVTGHFIKNGRRVGWRERSGYIHILFEGKRYRAHRLAWFLMTGEFPKNQIDHVNGIRDDNRWCNLREATQHQNNWNMCRPKTNTSGFKGVSWYARTKKWIAQIKIDGKSTHLGYFSTPEEAHEAYKEVALKHFGSFARFT